MLKKKKLRIKPIGYLVLLIIIIITIIIIIPKNHFKKYKINNYQIEERFNRKEQRYSIYFNKNDISYDFNFDSKYIGKKIINSIDELSNENEQCIIFKIKDVDTIPLCSKDNQNIDFRLINKINLNDYKKRRDKSTKTYDNIIMYDSLGKTYLIWNYNKFDYINDNERSDIKLFNSDYYDISLAIKYNDYLIIPNYDSLYNFNELLLINTKNKSVETWKLKYDISYESYFLGTVDDYLYLVDKKNKYEYRLNVKDREIKVVGNENNGGIIYKDGKFEDISMYKLTNSILSFENDNDVKFEIDNNNLYMKTSHNKTLVSERNISKIVDQSNNYVYYLVGDTLFYYDIFVGEIRALKNFEWNFNNNNNIFIY